MYVPNVESVGAQILGPGQSVTHWSNTHKTGESTRAYNGCHWCSPPDAQHRPPSPSFSECFHTIHQLPPSSEIFPKSGGWSLAFHPRYITCEHFLKSYSNTHQRASVAEEVLIRWKGRLIQWVSARLCPELPHCCASAHKWNSSGGREGRLAWAQCHGLLLTRGDPATCLAEWTLDPKKQKLMLSPLIYYRLSRKPASPLIAAWLHHRPSGFASLEKLELGWSKKSTRLRHKLQRGAKTLSNQDKF